MDDSNLEIIEQRRARFRKMMNQATLQVVKQRESRPPIPPQHKEGLMPCTFPATCPVHAKHTAAYGSYLELPKYVVPRFFYPDSDDAVSSTSNVVYTPSSSEAASNTSSAWSFPDSDEDEDLLKEKYRQDPGDLVPFFVRRGEEKEDGQQEGQGHHTNTDTIPVQKNRHRRRDHRASTTAERRRDRYLPRYDHEPGTVFHSPSPHGTSRSEEKGWDRYIPNYDDDYRRPASQRHYHRHHHGGSREQAGSVWDRYIPRYDNTLSKPHQIWQEEVKEEASKVKATATQKPPVVDEKQPSKPHRRHGLRIEKTRATRASTRKGIHSPSNRPYVKSSPSCTPATNGGKDAATSDGAPIYISIILIASYVWASYLYWHETSTASGYKLNIPSDSPTDEPVSRPITAIGIQWCAGTRPAISLCLVTFLICQVMLLVKCLLKHKEPEKSPEA